VKRWQSWVLLLVCLLSFAGPAFSLGPSLPGLTGPAAQMPEIKVFPNQLVQAEAVDPQLKSLFYRKPWTFDQETFIGVWQDVLHILPDLQAEFQRLENRNFSSSDYLKLSVLLLVFLLLLSARILDRYFQKRLISLIDFMPHHWPEVLRHSARLLIAVLSRSLIFLTTLFLTYLVWGSFSPESTFFPAFIHLLWIAVVYRVLHLLFYELLANTNTRYFEGEQAALALRLYRSIHLFLLYVALFLSGIAILEHIAYRADLINFLYFVLSGCVLLFSAYLLTNKKQIFTLLPSLNEPFYQRFLRFLGRFYNWVIGFTLALGVLWVVGYHNLTHMLFLRSWVLFSLFLGTVLLHRWLQSLIQETLQMGSEPSQLAKQLSRALWLLEALVFSQIFLILLDVREPLLNWLGYPIITIGNSSMSMLSIFSGFLTVFVFWLTSGLINAYLEERLFPKLDYDAGVHQMITLSIFYVAMGLGILMGLNVMGFDLSMFAIFAGALAFGIGFGLQGIAKNFASGIILIFTGLVKKGDYITVGEYTGYIQQVSWKKVHLRTPDHVDLIVPTVSLVESSIVNWTYSGKQVRVHIPVGVSYDSDVEEVRRVLLEVALEHPEVLPDPAPTVWLKAFGDSSLDFELLVWIDYECIIVERLRGEINFLIWKALKRHQIEIPFPQRDLHIRSGLPPAQPGNLTQTEEDSMGETVEQ